MEDSISHQGGFIERVFSDVHVARPLVEDLEDQEQGDDIMSGHQSSSEGDGAQTKKHPFQVAVENISAALGSTGAALQMLDGSLSSIDKMLRIKRSQVAVPPTFAPVACIADGTDSQENAVTLETTLRLRRSALNRAAASVAKARASMVESIRAGRLRHRTVASTSIAAAATMKQQLDADRTAAVSGLRSLRPWVGMVQALQLDAVLGARAGALGLWLLRDDASLPLALQMTNPASFEPNQHEGEALEPRPKRLRSTAGHGKAEGSEPALPLASASEWQEALQWPPQGTSAATGSKSASQAPVAAVLRAGFTGAAGSSTEGSSEPSGVFPVVATAVVKPRPLQRGGATRFFSEAAAAEGGGGKEASEDPSKAATGSGGEAAADVTGVCSLGGMGASAAPLVMSATVMVRADAASGSGWLAAGGGGVQASSVVLDAVRVRRPPGWRVAARAELWLPVGNEGGSQGGEVGKGPASAQARRLVQSLQALWRWVEVLGGLSLLAAGPSEAGSLDAGASGGQQAMEERGAARGVVIAGSPPMRGPHAGCVAGRVTGALVGVSAARAMLLDASAGAYDDVVVTRLRKAAAERDDGSAGKASRHTGTAPGPAAPTASSELVVAALAAVRRLTAWRFASVPVTADGSVVVVMGVDGMLGAPEEPAVGASGPPHVVHAVGDTAAELARTALEACGLRRMSMPADSASSSSGASDAASAEMHGVSGIQHLSRLRRIAIAGMLRWCCERDGRSGDGIGALQSGDSDEVLIEAGRSGRRAIAVSLGPTTGTAVSAPGAERIYPPTGVAVHAGPPRAAQGHGKDSSGVAALPVAEAPVLEIERLMRHFQRET